MPSTQLLTADDLDEIAHSSLSADDPLAVAAELVGAVEQGRIADKNDVCYALMLATEITERAGGLAAALGLAERAIEANRVHGDPEDGYPRARRAGLLLRLGRDDEAMTELTALRPHLETDPAAASWMLDALERVWPGPGPAPTAWRPRAAAR